MTKRNSSIEMLRIFSMFAIVIHHYAYHSTFNWQTYNTKFTGALRINVFLHYFGKLGVVLFVMIGAYFLCEKSFNFRRPINLMLITIFYSFGIYLAMKYILHIDIWVPHTLTSILLPFPLPSGYWFVYAYLVMLFAMPFLNIIVENLDRHKLSLLIVGLFCLWSLLPIGVKAFSLKPDTTIDNFGYTSATYFFLIYFIAAYIRKYGSTGILNSKKSTLCGAIITMLIAVLISLTISSQRSLNASLDLFDLNSPIALFNAAFIFSYARMFNTHNKIINYLAGSMFGVYLIHEDSFVRPYIWTYIISSKNYAFSTSKYLCVGLSYSFVVFVTCILIDIIFRRLFIQKYINSLSKILSNKLENILISNDSQR